MRILTCANCKAFDEAIGNGNMDHNVDILVMGHEHKFRALYTETRLGIRLPAWKSPFAYKANDQYPRFIGKHGAVVLGVDTDGVSVFPKLYKAIPGIDKFNGRA